jgi:hypothetical protein
MSRPWTVLDHSPLRELEQNVWEVTGTVPGMPIGRHMTAIKLSDGSLVIHNAVCLREEEQRRLDAWGPIRYVIVPNGWHRLDAPAYAERYPEAKVLCPEPARARVEKAVRVDGTFELLPHDPSLSVETLAGSRSQEAVFIARSGARSTLVFNDTVMNLGQIPGFMGWVYDLMGSSGGPKVTPLMRMLSVNDRGALRAHLTRLATLPEIAHIVPGHGSLIQGGELRAGLDAIVASA